MRKYIGLSILIGIAGCATQAERLQTGYKAVFEVASENFTTCANTVYSESVPKGYTDFLYIGERPTPIKYLQDESSLPSEYREVLWRRVDTLNGCISKYGEQLSTVDHRFAELSQSYISARSNLVAALTSNQITLGDFHRSTNELFDIAASAHNDLVSSIERNLAVSHANEVRARQDAWARASAALQNANNYSNQLNQTYSMPSASAPSLRQQGPACFFKSEITSGMNKICQYDCLGSPYFITIGSVSLCAPTVQGCIGSQCN